MKRSSTHYLAFLLLRLMAFLFNRRRALRRYLRSDQGWIDFSVGFRTESRSVEAGIVFQDGRVRALRRLPAQPDTIMIFRDDDAIREMLRVTPNETLNMLLRNKLRMSGNLAYLNLFNFFISLLLQKHHRKLGARQLKAREAQRLLEAPEVDAALRRELPSRAEQHLHGERVDPGVHHLEDPYLPQYSLDDFPRLRRYREVHFNLRPEICPERIQILTSWFKQHGFEYDQDGQPWNPELRQALAFKHLMEQRRPIIRGHSLLAGTHTTKEIGVLLYGDAQADMFWGELLSAPDRELRPYDLTEETRWLLHHEIFPFWAERNFQDWVRAKHGEPLCQQLDDRWAVTFMWKKVAISHTILDFPKLLKLGVSGIVAEIDARLSGDKLDDQQRVSLRAMKLCLEGLVAYARNLATEAVRLAAQEADPARRVELERMAACCARVPEQPAETLDEAHRPLLRPRRPVVPALLRG